MKKFLIAGTSLAAVAAAGSAGAVDVTLGGSIDMGMEYGIGKGLDDKAAANFALGDNYQSISISVAAAGTTDAGLKFGGSFGISTADQLKFNPYDTKTSDTKKHMFKLVNTSADVKLRGVGYNVSGGALVKPGSMVSVKINSEWYAADSKITTYSGEFNSIATTSAVCKLAGEVLVGAPDGNVTRGDASMISIKTGIARAGIATDGAFLLMTMDTVLGAKDVGLGVYNGLGNITVDNDGTIPADKVAMGPFMEVMMTSSTTKMVIGGVCVTHKAKKSKTAIHMDVASRVLHVSDASIYIEGGFGKLSVGTGAYGGSVAGVGSAGDQVKIDGKLNATLSSVSFLGFSGHGAVALDSVNLNNRPNYAFGTSTNLLGLTVAVEMEDEAASGGWIDLWDAGTSYDLNGMSVAIATDSAGDWAMSLGYELLGFAASSTIENVSKGGSAKAGLSIDTSLSTSLNGVGISVGLDESLAWSIGASYAMGNSGLSMYVNYSQADGGGKIGATMSF